MKIFLSILVAFGLTHGSVVLAQNPYNIYQPRSGSKYDWQSGNQYNWNQTYNGDTQVRGYNFNTGSTWNTTIKKNGDMQGTDSNFNSWTYNESTGNYYNYGTGKTCYGKGALRQCY